MGKLAERVAMACGIDAVETPRFAPENDATDAVLAAEKYGLFSHREAECGLAVMANGSLEWVVWRWGDSIDSVIGHGTFCQAICQAIIWFEERKEPHAN